MKYIFDPEILREVAHSHLDLPLDENALRHHSRPRRNGIPV